jgi:hypothetical protein
VEEGVVALRLSLQDCHLVFVRGACCEIRTPPWLRGNQQKLAILGDLAKFVPSGQSQRRCTGTSARNAENKPIPVSVKRTYPALR